MTTDLVTYYGQTPIIDQLVDKYGVYLEKLDRGTKLLLRMVLTNYVFMQSKHTPRSYTLTKASRDALFVRFLGVDIPQVLVDICSQLKGLTQLWKLKPYLRRYNIKSDGAMPVRSRVNRVRNGNLLSICRRAPEQQ